MAIFSSRAHIPISFKKLRNVRNLIIVSDFSCVSSRFVVNYDGGGGGAGGSGTIHIALNSTS